jgi:hypothetical protein
MKRPLLLVEHESSGSLFRLHGRKRNLPPIELFRAVWMLRIIGKRQESRCLHELYLHLVHRFELAFSRQSLSQRDHGILIEWQRLDENKKEWAPPVAAPDDLCSRWSDSLEDYLTRLLLFQTGLY